MASVNKVILIGRLGKDPIIRHTGAGKAVTSFSLATSERWTDKDGERQEKTEWHNVVVWGRMAESCAQYLMKGKEAYVEGRLQTRKYEKDGQERYLTEIVAQQVVFLGGRANGGGQNGKPFSYGQQGGFSEGSPPDDDDPF